MNREVMSQYDVMTVGEAPGIGLSDALDMVDEDRKELDMFFHFDLMGLDRAEGEVFKMNPDGWSLTEFKRIFSEWDAVFAERGWGSIFLNNHDFPRTVSRWGNDSPEYWYHSATLLHTFLLTMRGTPYFYFGDEIGMTNIRFDSIDQYKDINTINKYKQLENEGADLDAFIEDQKEAGRDNARTPMQWDDNHNAGFTTGQPWITINKNHKTGISVAAQEGNPDSVLHYFRKMTQVRKDHLGLVYGKYTLLDVGHEDVYAYTREWEGETFLVLLNFSTEMVDIYIPDSMSSVQEVIISNDDVIKGKLKPYQAIVMKN